MDLLTAYEIGSFMLRVLGFELHVSPTLLDQIDGRLMIAFDSHHDRLIRVLDGFHVLDHEKVSKFIYPGFQVIYFLDRSDIISF